MQKPSGSKPRGHKLAKVRVSFVGGGGERCEDEGSVRGGGKGPGLVGVWRVWKVDG